MKAWVITRETPNIDQENCLVIGFLSARKSPERVKEYVEWLYSHLELSVDEILSSVKYTRPTKIYEAEYFKISGINYSAGMHCGHNPFLIARLASEIKYVDEKWLEWREPDRFIFDTKSRRMKERIKGSKTKALVSLPFKITI